MVENIKEKYDLLTNKFDPDQFLPIRVEGVLQNKDEFIRYKLKRIIINHRLV